MNGASLININRGKYQEIKECTPPSGVPTPALYHQGIQLLEEAFTSGLLPRDVIYTVPKQIHYSLNYDLYDFSPGMMLIQMRRMARTKCVNISKKYILISRDSVKGLTVEDVDYAKYIIKRTATATGLSFGLIIDRVIGRREARRIAARKRQ